MTCVTRCLIALPEEQARIYADPTFRAEFREACTTTPKAFSGQWQQTQVCKVGKPAHQAWLGKSIAELSQQADTDPFDTLF